MDLQPIDITLIFHGDLVKLLPKRQGEQIVYPLTRRASIKDVIESCKIPHTEVGNITFENMSIDFDYIPETAGKINIYPVPVSSIHSPASTLLRSAPAQFRFMVDINVAKLAPLLRMAGLSAELLPLISTGKLVEIASLINKRQSILLTRNRELLKIREVVHGRLLRSQEPAVQLKEVITLYGLQSELKPFSRCMICNGLLKIVAKSDIEHRLLPLTKKYYSQFKQCRGCQKIYWRGSHHERMVKLIKTVI